MNLWQRILSWLGLYKEDPAPVVTPKPDPVEQPKPPVIVPFPKPETLPPAAHKDWTDSDTWNDGEKFVHL